MAGDESAKCCSSFGTNERGDRVQRVSLKRSKSCPEVPQQIIPPSFRLPIVVDAGIGAPSHAAEAMEMGADAVLVNTAIAVAADPVRMVRAFKSAVAAGRAAYEIGFAPPTQEASPTSPLTTFLHESN